MRVSREDLEASLARVREIAGPPLHGIHGPASAAWSFQRDGLIFLGGGRAALLQLAHPFVAYAIDQHSQTRSDVVGRTQRTFRNVFAMSFGSLDDAFQSARRVHTVHCHINGELPETVGPFPAGTRYAANDVDGLLWVYATLIDTVVQLNDLLLGPVTLHQKEAYYRSSWQFARLFGIPDQALPPDFGAFRRYVDDIIASPLLTVAPPAREMAVFLFGRGEGQSRGRLGAFVELLTAGLLPARLRRDFGLPWSAGRRVAFEAVMAGMRPLARLTPRRLRYLPAYRAARRRIDGRAPSELEAWLENRLFGLAAVVSGSGSMPARRS